MTGPFPVVNSGCRHAIRCALVLLLALGSQACDAARQQSGSEPIVRDSAGIRIVRNLSPEWSGSPEEVWSLSPEPVLEIGVLEGDPAYMFSQLRAPKRLADGSIVVFDGSSGEIRIFDAQGRHTRSFGGKGQGPGQFQAAGGPVLFPGDSIAIWDILLQRLSIFASDGTLGRELKLEEYQGEGVSRADFSGRLPNGDLLAIGSLYRPVAIPDDPQGLRWTKAALLRYASDGSDPRLIAEMERIPCDPAHASECSFVAYGAQGSFAFHGDRLYTGRSDRNEIRVFDEAGRLVSKIYGSAPLQPVTDELRAEFIEAVAAGDPSREAERREHASRAQFSAVVPAFHGLLIDKVGNTWTREYRVEEGMFGYSPVFPPRTEGFRFTVYDADGAELGQVMLPMKFDVSEVGSDYVLGVGRDDLDVQRVQMYSIFKP